jgi:hypothetical protein
MADYGNPWAQIPQALQNVTVNATNMQKMQQDAEMMREQKINLQQQNQLGAINLQKAMEEQARKNEVVPLSEHPTFKNLPVEAQNNITQSFVGGKYGQYKDGMLTGRRQDISRFMQDMSMNTDALEQVLIKPMVNQANAGYQKAFQDYQKVSEKFKSGQATQQELDAAKGAADSAYGQLSSTMNRGQTALAKSQMSKTLMDLQASGQLQALPPELQLTIQSAYQTGNVQAFQTALEKYTEIQAKKAEFVKVSQGEKVIDPVTKQVIAQGEAKTPNEIELQIRANAGDQQAKQILNQIQADKIRVAQESRPKDMGEASAKLRKEFNNLQEIKDYNNIKTKYNGMVVALQEANTSKNLVAADQALITLFNKMTDPNSVVRESEYARTGANIPLINQIKGKANKIISGGAGLTPEERTAIVRMGKLFMGTYQNNYNQRTEEYKGYARQRGLDPDTVIAPINQQNNVPSSGGIAEGTTATNPQTGQRIVFKGGQWQIAK